MFKVTNKRSNIVMYCNKEHKQDAILTYNTVVHKASHRTVAEETVDFEPIVPKNSYLLCTDDEQLRSLSDRIVYQKLSIDTLKKACSDFKLEMANLKKELEVAHARQSELQEKIEEQDRQIVALQKKVVPKSLH